jgi:hypothetical protein
MLYPLSYRRPSHTRVNDWSRIADPRGVDEISAPLDLRPRDSEDRTVPCFLRVLAATAAVALLAGCSSDGGPAEPDGSSSVAAFPDLPHFDGPLEVVLQPALSMVTETAGCTPDPAAHRVCSADGRHGYRVLGEPSDATIAEVSTAPSEDHLSWTAEIRFQASSRTAVTAARDAAAGVGGMVLVTVDDAVLIAVRPDEITPTAVRLFDLEKPEAWAIPELFPGV